MEKTGPIPARVASMVIVSDKQGVIVDTHVCLFQACVKLHL